VARVGHQPVGHTHDHVAGACDVRDLAGVAHAQAQRAEDRIRGAQADRDLAAAQARGGLIPQRPARRGRQHPRQGGQVRRAGPPRRRTVLPRAGPPQQASRRRDHAGVPAAVLEPVAAETGCGARVGGELAGQPREQVVLGGEHPRRGGGPGGLLIGHPQEHRQQVAAVHPLPGQPVQGIGAALFTQLVAAGVAAAVLPGDRRAVRLAAGPGGDQSRDHRGQADAPPPPRRHHAAELAGDRLGRRDPVLRCLLTGPGCGPARRVRGAAPGCHGA